MSLVERARAVAAELPAHRHSHDVTRRLDPKVVATLRASGLLAALAPRELGGDELDPARYAEMLEVLAAGDAATAWCVMTSTTTSVLSAYLPRETATALSAGATPFFAGVFAPGGRLVDGKLAGTWSFGSGAVHADWFALGALVGRRHVLCFLPRTDVRIVDNWNPLGLAGTGSHDLAVEGVAVADGHVTSVFDRAPWSDAPLYRMPVFGLLAVGVAACAIGIARSALDQVAAKLGVDPSSAALAKYAEARGDLDACRAYLAATCSRAYARAQASAVDSAVRGELRLAAAHVARRCAEVGRAAFHLGGGAAMREGHPLGNALRDLETVLTHRMVTERVAPTAVRALLGLGTPPPDL